MKKRVLILIVCLALCAAFLQVLPHGVAATENPTAIGMTEFALKANREGWGYVYGTYGQIATQTLIDGKANQYPSVFSEIMSDGRTAYQNSQEWISHRVADCVGLMKAYLWWQGDASAPAYVSAQDKSANGLYLSSTVSGPISTIPETHGLLVWRNGHIGVYVGNGWVIEARGCEYGVVKTRLSDRGWTNWCQHPSISYNANGWVSIAGQTLYYRNGCFVTGLQVIDGKTYLFDADGIRLTGFNLVNGELRYFQADGSQLTGWQTIEGSRYFLNDGKASIGWTVVDGQNRLFSTSGILQGGWQQTEQGISYLNADGVALTGVQTIDTLNHEFDSAGNLLTGWQNIAGQWRYYNWLGQSLTGQQLIGSQTFMFDTNGVRLSGWQTREGKTYYFDPASGAGTSEGLNTIEAQPRLIGLDGSLINTAGLVFSQNKIYLSDSSGLALTGLQTVSGTNLQFAAGFDLQMKNQELFSLTPAASPLTLAVQPSVLLSVLKTEAAVDLPLTWSSLDPAIATVDETGLVTAVGTGRTLIVLKTAAGTYAAALITVLPDPSTITAAAETLNLEIGRSADLTVSGMPSALLTDCTLTSTDPTVATVDSHGRITALKAGQTSIKLAYAGTEMVVQNISVKVPLLGLSVSRTALTLPIGAKANTFASLVPVTANSSITYLSSVPAVASVDSNGRIKALTQGTTVITATAGGASASCTVTVNGYYPTLRRGSSGSYVTQLQQRLSDLGYLIGSSDGFYGPLTEYAVNCFQKNLNLYLTGQADHHLQLALQADSAPRAAAVQVAGTLRSGDSGESVFVLQQRLFELNLLKALPNGTFDSRTVMAVQVLQNLNSMTQTDFVDSGTISTLYSRTVIAGKTTLIPGDSGYEVLLLQTRLQQLQYYNGPLDGQYSTVVGQAVAAFQSMARLSADGQAGTLTQRALYADNAPAYVPPVVPPTPSVLTVGTSSGEVAALEARLVNLGFHLAAADASFDGLTASSVRAFQARAGLAQTGVADLNTQNRLYASTAPRSLASYKYGSASEAVRLIQQRLNQLGFSCGTADGRFGSRTLTAVKGFQGRAGLTIDGTVGSRTIASLFAGASAPVAPVIGTTPTVAPITVQPVTGISRTLRYGSSGGDVKTLQQQLNQLGYTCGTADGRFGRMTLTAVKAFQQRAGLVVDGIFGSRSRNVLFGANPPAAR